MRVEHHLKDRKAFIEARSYENRLGRRARASAKRHEEAMKIATRNRRERNARLCGREPSW